MSRFPNQLALVSVSILALTAGAVGLYERAAHNAELAAEAAAHAVEEERMRAEAEAAVAAPEAETAPDAVAEAPVEATAPEEAEPVVADADTSAHGHGDPGTAPIASILAGAAVAQSVDSPALDATGVMYGLGRTAMAEEIAAWDIDVRPDGLGLPEGSGDVWTGEEVFVDNCAVCHGDFAEGVDRWPVLAGGLGSLTHDRPVKTIGSYWPYLSTVWDYVNRAMPFGYAQSLEPDQVYAITAYLLYSNGIVEDDFVLSKDNFTEVRMPNEENFFMDDRAEGELEAFSQEPCMTDCKDSVEVTMRAVMLDVTPDVEGTATEAAVIEVPAPEAEVEAEAEVVEAAAASAVDPALVAAGEAAFRQCSTCHQVGEDAANRVGPHLNGVIGRTAGTIEGFRYSSVMAEAGAGGLVWTAETLHDFLLKPRDYMRGTKMSFNGFRDEADIAAVTAYLSTYTD